jgi:hypothetical protein
MKRLLLIGPLCLLVICLTGSAFAALGETEAQIARRYGPGFVPPITNADAEVLEKYHFRAYLKQPYYITVWFNKSGLAELEEVEKWRAPSLNNGRPIAQDFNDQEIQAFLDVNSSYSGPFVELHPNDGWREWTSANRGAMAELISLEHEFATGDKAMIQTLRVETLEWEIWREDYVKRTGSQQ